LCSGHLCSITAEQSNDDDSRNANVAPVL
jgi:hypothetical protein